MSHLSCNQPTNRIYRAIPDLQSLLGMTTASTPNTRIHEDKDNYYIQIDLPGVRKEDVKVEVHSGELKVSAERNLGFNDQAQKAAFNKTFILPDDADQTKISAEQKDGVLNLVLAKKEEAKPITVQVNVN